MFPAQRIYNATHVGFDNESSAFRGEIYRKQLMKAVLIRRAVKLWRLLRTDGLAELVLRRPGEEFEESINYICEQAVGPLFDLLLREAHAHSCRAGADCRDFVMLDGNAKVHRAMCAYKVLSLYMYITRGRALIFPEKVVGDRLIYNMIRLRGECMLLMLSKLGVRICTCVYTCVPAFPFTLINFFPRSTARSTPSKS